FHAFLPLPAARVRRSHEGWIPRLGVSADDDAREDDGGGFGAGGDRLGEPRPALLEQARGGRAGGGGSGARGGAGEAVRGGRGSGEGAALIPGAGRGALTTIMTMLGCHLSGPGELREGARAADNALAR